MAAWRPPPDIGGMDAKYKQPKVRTRVVMTAAEQRRQDLQVEWLRQAIAARHREPAALLDPDSLRLPRPIPA